MTDTVFDKTDKGREEIQTRGHHLAARLRTLLLLVDGKRGTTELMAKTGGLGLDEKALVELLEGGFISVVASSGTGSASPPPPTAGTPAAPIATAAAPLVPAVDPIAAPVTPQAPDNPAVANRATDAPDAPVAVRATTEDRTQPASQANGTVGAAGAAQAAAKGILREGETQFQALYNFFNETIRSAIGLRGYGMQLKVERAATLDDFRALRQPYLDAVRKAKGPELEHSLRNRLDQLLNLAD